MRQEGPVGQDRVEKGVRHQTLDRPSDEQVHAALESERVPVMCIVSEAEGFIIFKCLSLSHLS